MAKGPGPTLTERIAQAVVEAALPGAVMTFNESQSNGECDFRLRLADGSCAVVEVTLHAERAKIEIARAIVSPRKGGHFVPVSKCVLGWWLHPEPDANINLIRAKIDEYLYRIESAGIREFSCWADSRENADVARIWCDLKIESGSVVGWKTPGVVGIAIPGDGGELDPESIVVCLAGC